MDADSVETFKLAVLVFLVALGWLLWIIGPSIK